jgi:flagellar biosynthesis/type III secretory pathway protein FliH
MWQSEGDFRIASPRLVMRAAEVPLLADAQTLRERLQALHDERAAQLNAARAEAHASGLAQGLDHGRLAARAELAAALTEMSTTAAQRHEQLREQVAALALQVARKLMGNLALPEQLVALADTAARDTMPAQNLTLVVHPDQIDAVRTRLDMQAATEDSPLVALKFELRADAGCALDACRLETELGSVDASLDAQLQRLANAWSIGAPR